jgi:hypothetical protein
MEGYLKRVRKNSDKLDINKDIAEKAIPTENEQFLNGFGRLNFMRC